MFLNKFRFREKIIISFLIVTVIFLSQTFFGIINIGQLSREAIMLHKEYIKPLEEMEAMKSDFAKLHRLELMTIIYGMSGKEKEASKTIADINNLHDVIVYDTNAMLQKLEQEGAAHINDIKSYQSRMANEYWPGIERANAALLAGDMDAMLTELYNVIEIADIQNERVTLVLEERINASEKQAEDITMQARQAEMILIVIAAISLIAVIAFATYVGNTISRPIADINKSLLELSHGNFDIDTHCDTKDELKDLMASLETVASTMKGMVVNIGIMTDSFIMGDITNKVDTSMLQGSYKDMAEGINKMTEDIMRDVLEFLDYMIIFINGDFNVEMSLRPGKKRLMNETLDSMRNNLNTISQEISVLIFAAKEGRLSARADVSKYKGGWADIMTSLNSLMEAVEMPIHESEVVLKQVAMGDFKAKINGEYSGEFLQIKNSINNMVENISSYIDEISIVLTALSEDNLDQYIDREYIGRFTDIKCALNNIIDKFNTVIMQIASSADQVANGAKQVSASSIILAQGAAEQAAAIEELSATVQIINANTEQNAKSAKSAKEFSERTKANAIIGDQEMKNMLLAMSSIKESSNSISKIIKVIDDIAFQTNLLALNAAVEAARAGTSGKGFAVVAGEVRDLAARSKEAARETAVLIEESILRVDEGKQMADVTADALGTIVENITNVAGIISEISDASDMQTNAINQVTDGLSQITEVVQNNSTTSQDAASASEELSGQAETLRNLVGVFSMKKMRNHNYYNDELEEDSPFGP